MAPASFDELRPILPDAERKVRALICMLMGFPPERVKRLRFYDGSALEEGRTGMDIDFEPDLNAAEQVRFKRLMHTFFTGKRPPILVEKV
jgi:hypothetical protein